MSARFSIGIDLGTTNSALAFVALDAEASSRARESGRGDPVPDAVHDVRQRIASPPARNDGGGRADGGAAQSDVLQVPQWEAASRLIEAAILPSFLYLPEDESELAGRESGRGQWVAGRLARAMAGERPGRVAQSAKSWLCHPGADPSAPFLPWGSDEIAPDRKISPVRASALVLNALRGAWDSRFAALGAGFRFDAQAITVTVPASFDASAQRLTLRAAGEAGFPSGVRLLEEPQAAFYAWLESHDATSELWRRLSPAEGESHHILVVDIGGGTSDFSLFEIRAVAGSPEPAIRRIAVSDHILLGGDNIDLAIAHKVERRLVEAGGTLSGAQWDFLVARCRDLKERALAGEEVGEGGPDDAFPVAIPGQGAGLIAGTLSAQITRAEIDAILFDGFFPTCPADARPYKPASALREWGLPFAADGAVTRHLAAFLVGRPKVDAVLFNGGSLSPPRLRTRLAEQIGGWQGTGQGGTVPLVLDNAQPDLAVARGAARFGALVHRKGTRIEAGAAHGVFLALHRAGQDGGKGGGGKGEPSLVCVLPRGAAPEVMHEISEPAMELRINRPVRFQAYTSTRHEGTGAGTVVAWNARDFRPLPALETLARIDDGRFDETRHRDARRTLPVALTASLNELGLLQVSLVSTDPAVRQSWPLDFNLRPREQGDALQDGDETARSAEPNVSLPAMEAARQRLQALFAPSPAGKGKSSGKRGLSDKAKATKVTGARAFKDLETALGLPKADWNWVVLRELWPTLEDCMPGRAVSVEHEETWLILAGFLLRPGFGAAGDEARIDGLWRLHEARLCFPGKRIRPQVHILWRRVAGGLSHERQEQLFADEIEGIRQRGDATPELIHLLGSLERLGHEAKMELIERFIEAGLARAQAQKHPAPYFTALSLLLNRAPLYAGPETVVPPEQVERAFEAFAKLDWRDTANAELATLFLRAARVVDNRSLDVSRSVRQKIASKLEKAGVPTLRVAKVRNFMPMERSERLSLYAEALPPGLLLRADG